MLQFRCDWCGREKRPDQHWILGLAVQRSGITGNRRQFETLKKWSAKWAAHPLAVHFCSEKHKDEYIDALFTSPWPSVGKNAFTKAAYSRRAERGTRKQDPDLVAEWYIEKEKSSASQDETKTRTKRRRRKTEKNPNDLFTSTDRFHARALGIVLDPEDDPQPKEDS